LHHGVLLGGYTELGLEEFDEVGNALKAQIIADF
jgi:hypothetical protein